MDAISDVSRGSEIFSAVPTFPPLPHPLDLDELFGFSAAARRRLVEEPVETEYFCPNKIFINHVDSFTGKYIVSVLSNKHGTSLGDQDLENNVDNQTVQKENVVSGRKKTTQIDPEYPSIQETSNTIIINKPNKESADLGISNSFEYDTSKLTVAEYYEMMEFESLESRYDYVKDKLGKFYSNLCKDDSSKFEFDTLVQDKTPSSNVTGNDFEIIGTVKNHSGGIKGVTEILQMTYNDPEFLDRIVTCGIVIYCLNEDLSQAKEASWVFNYIINFENGMTKQELQHVCSPIFVLLSTFMTWSLTKTLSLNEDLPFIEKDYRKRKPHPNYEVLYDLEEFLVKARIYHRVKTVIIVCGITYGHEESELCYLFEKAHSYKQLPIYSNGNNIVPMVHIENLGHIVKKVIDKMDDITIPFVFAQDPIQNTIAEITKGISLNLGTGFCEYQPKEVSFTNDMISQDLYNKLTNKIYLESCYPLFKEEDIPWKYESGFADNINQIVKEFLDAKRLKPLKIIFYGETERLCLKDTVRKVSEYFQIPLVQIENVICDYVDEVLKKQSKYDEQKLLNPAQDIQTVNFTRSFNIPPVELFLSGDEKLIEDEIEILNKLNIHSSDEAKLLQLSDKISILTRKLQMKPYVYQGYFLEEFPQNLLEANILFSNTNKDVLDNSISIFPDIVIFYEFKDSKSQVSSELNIQLQTNENQLFEASTVAKTREEERFLNTDNDEAPTFKDIDAGTKASNEINKTEGHASSSKKVEDKITESPMFLYFSKSHQDCAVITLTINEKDDENKTVQKTINKIEHIFLQDKNENSFSADETFQDIPVISLDEGTKIKNQNSNQNSQNLKLDNPVNINTERLREAEEISLAIKSNLLISYLIKFISPTLTNGILEIAAQMSFDPIDFLAEYIFQNNPDGRMIAQNESKLSALLKKKPVPVIDSKMCLA